MKYLPVPVIHRGVVTKIQRKLEVCAEIPRDCDVDGVAARCNGWVRTETDIHWQQTCKNIIVRINLNNSCWYSCHCKKRSCLISLWVKFVFEGITAMALRYHYSMCTVNLVINFPCYRPLKTLRRHFDSTSKALRRHFEGTTLHAHWRYWCNYARVSRLSLIDGSSKALRWHFDGTSKALVYWYNNCTDVTFKLPS